ELLDEILWFTAALHAVRYISFLLRKRAPGDAPKSKPAENFVNILAVANEWIFALVVVVAIHLSVFKPWITLAGYREMTHVTFLLLVAILLLSWKLRRARKLP